MKLQNELKEIAEKIFQSKREYHKEMAKMPIEEKIKILLKLQEIGIKANKNMKDKKVWAI
ncbi:MAG: hypothetical protein EHM58_06865 [Ignavibacteriae bacterium]|nr:MAG: hypothetical protein EHM58_06865 [Ignavibacteriota bacterium]